MFYGVNEKTYKDYINKLSLITRAANIPVEYRQNYLDPFKPFFNCPYDLITPYQYAISILSKYNIDEIMEIKNYLSGLVISHAKAVVEAIKKQADKSYTFKDFLKINDLLIYYLNHNMDQVNDKKFRTIDLYAVMSIKFIKRAVMSNIREKKARKERSKRELEGKNKKITEDSLFELGIEVKPGYCPHCLHKETRKYRLGGSYINNIIYAMDSLFVGNLIDTHNKNLLKIKERMKGISKFQQQVNEDQRYILNMASELWENDQEKLLRTGYVANLIYNDLVGQNKNKYTLNTIKDWIKEIKPDYAGNRGRETKKNRELLFELYKLKIF